MSIQLPSGKVIPIEGVPEGTTKEALKQKLISNGLATEDDFMPPTGSAEVNLPPLAEGADALGRARLSMFGIEGDETMQDLMGKTKDSAGFKLPSPGPLTFNLPPLLEGTDALGKARLANAGVEGDETMQDLLGKRPNPVTTPAMLPYGMPPALVEATKRTTERKIKKIDDIRNDPRLMAQYKFAKDTPSSVAGLVSVGSELNALGSGVSDLIDQYLPGHVADLLNYRVGGDNSMGVKERIAAREKEMGQAKEMQEILDIAHPFATMAGKAAPYLLTEAVGAPLLNAAGRGIKRGVNKVVDPALERLERYEANAAKSDAPIVRASNNIVSPIIDAGRYIQKNVSGDKEYSNAVKALIRAPALGAAEGGANYNDTALSGAMASTIGQLGGNTSMFTNLGRTHNRLSTSERQALRTATRSGYHATPGMKTGNLEMQAFESGLRSEPGYRTSMQSLDVENETAKVRMASKAMGIDDSKVLEKDFTPEVLGDHLTNLKKEYTNLENTTTGHLNMSGLRESQKIIDELRPGLRSRDVDERARYNKVMAIFDDFRQKNSTVSRDARGRFDGYKFDGKEYQNIRSRIQDEATQAYRKGDDRLGDKLIQMKEILDKSLTRGMNKSTAKEWKDLNERYAMTEIVMNNGLDGLGGIDTRKLTNHLMSDAEAKRTLLGQGNRIKHLQAIEKIGVLEDRMHKGMGWNGTGTDVPTGKVSMAQRIMQMPITSTLSPTKRASMGMYLSGFPSVTGYTGLPKPLISSMIRANAQGGGVLPAAGAASTMVGMGVMDGFDKLMEAMNFR